MNTYKNLSQSFDVTLETFDGIDDTFLDHIEGLNDDLYDFALEVDTQQMQDLSQYLDASIQRLDHYHLLPTDLLDCVEYLRDTLYDLSVEEDEALMLNTWEASMDV